MLNELKLHLNTLSSSEVITKIVQGRVIHLCTLEELHSITGFVKFHITVHASHNT